MKPGRIHEKNPREIWDLSDLPVPLNRNCTSSIVGNSRVSWRCEPSWGLITCRQWRVATTGCSLYRVETPQSGGDCGEGRAATLLSALLGHISTLCPPAGKSETNSMTTPSTWPVLALLLISRAAGDCGQDCAPHYVTDCQVCHNIHVKQCDIVTKTVMAPVKVRKCYPVRLTTFDGLECRDGARTRCKVRYNQHQTWLFSSEWWTSGQILTRGTGMRQGHETNLVKEMVWCSPLKSIMTSCAGALLSQSRGPPCEFQCFTFRLQFDFTLTCDPALFTSWLGILLPQLFAINNSLWNTRKVKLSVSAN